MTFNKKDSVASAVTDVLQQEALKGNQKKIDKNHNNKIDADDFKILRGEKGEKKVAEEIDINDASEDGLGGQKKVKRKDDVGPSGDFKPSKVRFHAGPKNESLEEPLEKVLADTAPHSGVIKTVMATDELDDRNKSIQNKTKLKMKEDTEQLDEKNWIAGAIKKPGAMTAAAKREGKSTSEYIKSHEHEGGKAGQRARLAKTLKSFKEQYADFSIYDDLINEVLSKDASAGAWIHDFIHSDNPKFAGKSKAERKKMALAAYYGKQNEEAEIEEELKGKQYKLDKNKNGKLDSDDFKKLRNEGEECSCDDEGHEDEKEDKALVKKLVKKDALKKEEIDPNVRTKDVIRGRKPTNQKDDVGPGSDGKSTKVKFRGGPMEEEVEQIDEISLDTMKSAREKLGNKALDAHYDDNKYAARHYAGRALKMSSRIKKKEREVTKEEIETIDEATPPKNTDVSDKSWLKDAGKKPTVKSDLKNLGRFLTGKKETNESKRPEQDNVPFAPPYDKARDDVVTDKSGAKHTPMSRAKDLARTAMKKIKSDMLGNSGSK